MRTKNAMQLKAIISNRAKEGGVPPQLVMQSYLLERLLERISLSPWRDSVVVKGGVLISSLMGVDRRSTKDLDATVRDFPLTHENAERAFREIAAVEADDDFSFEFVRTEDIRETDDYPGIRVHLLASYEKMRSPVTVDVTTGDKITPDAVEYSYPLMFDNRSLSLMAYPLPTTLAEKLETVVSRGIANTRPRDYYDLRMLWLTRRAEVEPDVLRERPCGYIREARHACRDGQLPRGDGRGGLRRRHAGSMGGVRPQVSVRGRHDPRRDMRDGCSDHGGH